MADLQVVQARAEVLIELHLGHLHEPWRFDWDHARRRAGACHHSKFLITLSRHITILGTEDDAEQTVLHEIAHALCGKSENHSPRWLDMARSLGYTGMVRHDGAVPEHLARWRGTCPAGHVITRYRRPRNMVASCSVCNPRFSRAHLITWEQLI